MQRNQVSCLKFKQKILCAQRRAKVFVIFSMIASSTFQKDVGSQTIFFLQALEGSTIISLMLVQILAGQLEAWYACHPGRVVRCLYFAT